VDPDDFASGFKRNTRLVVVNHASNVIGTVQPIKEIGKLCREKGVTFLVDASQTAGKLPIDIEQLNVDVVAFTGHKSMLGPTGIGGLYVNKNVLIHHTRAGGTGVRSAQRHHLDDYPYRLEYGTLNTLGIAGLNAGLNWVMEKGIDTIHQQEMKLTRQLRDGLNRIDNVITYCTDTLTNHIGILSFNIKGFEAANTGTLLDGDYHIAVRTGLHCAPLVHEQLGTAEINGTVRIGIGPFNTQAHIEKTLTSIKEIALAFGKG
jgi:selenocysteine lyase/cysteine desulfurase